MTEDDLIKRLQEDARLSKEWATAFVEASGRCEYCGRDLLMDRFGYAVAELDHILPTSKYPDFKPKDPNQNLALACRTCNGVKGSFDPLAVSASEDTPDTALPEKRGEILQRIRDHIAFQMAAYDKDWRAATEILQSAWWAYGEQVASQSSP